MPSIVLKKKSDNWKAYLTIAVILLLIVVIYFLYFFHYNCDDLSCFYGHQEQCVRTSFINDQQDTTWEYYIRGEEDGKCVINVKVLKIKAGTADKQKLEGLDMDCYLSLGSISSPESDISRCHGTLKEEMQNLIIQKLHAYIVESVGEIGKELEGLENIVSMTEDNESVI